MCAAGERLLANHRNFTSVAGTAGPPNHEIMLAELWALFGEDAEIRSVSMRCTTKVCIGRL